MARVKLLEKDQADPIITEMFQKLENNKSPIINLYKAVGNSPKVGRNFIRLGNAVLNPEILDPRLRELAILRVGNLLRSEYEFTKHVVIGQNTGVTMEQINDLSNWKSSKNFSDIERAVLQYTDEMTLDVKVSDETFAGLKRFFDDAAIVKLTITIGYYGMVSRILVALQIELETGEEAFKPVY
jgi:4-carboxymuconolactone decarboxylase